MNTLRPENIQKLGWEEYKNLQVISFEAGGTALPCAKSSAAIAFRISGPGRDWRFTQAGDVTGQGYTVSPLSIASGSYLTVVGSPAAS